MAEKLIKEYKLDKIFFVPVGNYYKKDGLIDANHRHNMLKLAVANHKQLEVEKLAIESKIKLYASDTFKLIKEKYKKDDIFFIMGSDNFKKISTWKNYEELIKNYNIIVIERENNIGEKASVCPKTSNNIISFIPEKFEKIDSTQIRKMIKNNENTEKYLNQNVYNYIKENKLYM